jgi:type 1 glutamine amidotransferase
VFYTALGDWEETWNDPRYRVHLTGDIRWAIRLEDDESPPGAPPPREPLREVRW